MLKGSAQGILIVVGDKDCILQNCDKLPKSLQGSTQSKKVSVQNLQRLTNIIILIEEIISTCINYDNYVSVHTLWKTCKHDIRNVWEMFE